MNKQYNSADVNYLLDESIREVKQATNYIIKEAASHYYTNPDTANNSIKYRVNFHEVSELAKRGN